MPQMVEKVRESWKGASSKKRGLPERRILEYSPEGQPFTPELINEFLDVMTKAGRAENTLDVYRRCLNRLYEYLPDEKNIRTGTINAWTCSLAEFGDYTDSSIEIYCTSANMFLDWCGRADLRGNTDSCEKKKKGIQPELTRKEYHRLLNVAKQADNEAVYLMVKAFGLLGNAVSELSSLTVESVKKGRVRFPRSGVCYIPSAFRKELLEYVGRVGCFHGPVFVSKNGMPLDRSNIWRYIRNLSMDAQVDENKCTPRCLAGMCRQTKAGIRQNVMLLEEQMYERLLEEEQDTLGWSG